jgi:F-type H+-transporting ATPase subunit b
MEVLGFNSLLLLAQLVSFGIVFFVLKKFLYSKLKKSLEDRRESIAQIVVKNSEVETKIQELESEKVELQMKNQTEIQKLTADAQKNAEKLKKDILDQTDLKSKKMIKEAGEIIDREKVKASKDLKLEAGKLAKEMAAKILSQSGNSKKVMELSINELGKLTKRAGK